MSQPSMLGAMRRAALLSALDYHFARALERMAPAEEAVLVAAAQASRLADTGHVCLPLDELAGRAVLDEENEPVEGLRWPARKTWIEALEGSALVSCGDVSTPLVLDPQGRLYLRRFWVHEQRLAQQLNARITGGDVALDPGVLREGLRRLFGKPLRQGVDSPADGQRLAALLALQHRFCVITGGPGTGKTFTVVGLLTLLLEQAQQSGRAIDCTLLAPTGKAAARLSAAIKEAKLGLDCSDRIREALPDEASTIHRCLRPRFGGRTRFRHHAGNPLPTDVVIVDEASMVDLELMAQLVDAIPPAARLILLGDPDQLASVAPGAVLADVCGGTSSRGHSEALAARLEEQTGDRITLGSAAPKAAGIWDCIAQLTHSFRFGRDSGIGALARAVSRGDGEAALACLAADEYDDVALAPPPSLAGSEGLLAAALRGFERYARQAEPAQMLDALGRYRILCAHRRGPFGVEAVNAAVAGALQAARRLHPTGRWYAGQPVLITQNDYALRLFNGDVGVIVGEPDGGSLRAHFIDPDGQTRTFLPARLPAHETAFAMTVHKSQGSELDEVTLVLPDRMSRILTRELLYTAVTRARKRVTIFGTSEVIRDAIARRAERSSGLRDLLWARRPTES
ncbi:MAG: exodeoxyribonuclease V subunit alpha [bacterium]